MQLGLHTVLQGLATWETEAEGLQVWSLPEQPNEPLFENKILQKSGSSLEGQYFPSMPTILGSIHSIVNTNELLHEELTWTSLIFSKYPLSKHILNTYFYWIHVSLGVC